MAAVRIVASFLTGLDIASYDSIFVCDQNNADHFASAIVVVSDTLLTSERNCSKDKITK